MMEFVIIGMAGWFIIGAPLVAGVAVAIWPPRAAQSAPRMVERRTVYTVHPSRGIVARRDDLRMVWGQHV